jgi:hypothetical protein
MLKMLLIMCSLLEKLRRCGGCDRNVMHSRRRRSRRRRIGWHLK